MNILVITREIPPVGGGAGIVAIHLAEELACLGNKIFIISMHYKDLPLYEERANGQIVIFRVPVGRRNQDNSYPLEMLRFVIAARSVAKEIAVKFKCHAVHAHAILPDGLIALHASKAAGIPAIITSHGSDVPGHNIQNIKFELMHKMLSPLWHRTLNKIHLLVAPSKNFADKIKKLRSGQHIAVIPNGINTGIFTPRKKDNSFLICSRLVKGKNFHLFLDALKEISAPQTVHIVGDGPMTTELKKLAAEVPQHRIIFYGWLDYGSQQWRSLYETCSFFVMPSANESFGITLLEAQLANMIVLASPIPVHKEVLGDYAVYFKSLKTSDIAATIKLILNGKSVNNNYLSEKSLKRIHENFAWDKIARSYLHIFENLNFLSFHFFLLDYLQL